VSCPRALRRAAEEVRTMLNEKMGKALNDQINAEFYSSYLYLSMAAYFESINLKGFANWMRVQAQEEDFHAKKLFGFVADRSGRVLLQAIKAPPHDWGSPLAVFEAAYKHECHVTDLINKLVDLSVKLSDHATNNFLQWFVGEQVEEEANADAIIQQLKLIGNDGHGLFMIDRELATRVFTPPPAAGAVAGA
jgi:ferritin